MKKLLIVVAVLALLAVGLDRGGVLVAEQVAGSSLQTSQGLAEEPEVDVTGFPFLDQLATGRYERVDVMARDLPLGEERAALQLKRIDVVLLDVVTARDYSRIDVGRARADAVLSYADLGSALGIDLAYAGPGALEASRTVTVLGQDVTPSITVEPAVVDGALSLATFSIDGAVEGADAVTTALQEVFGAPVPLQGIPFDVELDSISAERHGLHLALSGSDLSYVAP